jgi:hypothetical protein
MERVKIGVAECELRKGAIPILAVQLPLGHVFSVDHMYLDHVYLNSCLYIIRYVASRRKSHCVCVLSLSP